MEWQFADAKKRFTELVDRALAKGPQHVHRDGDTVVVIAERDYDKLIGKRPEFKDFLMGTGPSFERLDLARHQLPMRSAKF